MKDDCIHSTLEETGFYYTMKRIQGKYKMFILYVLSDRDTVRFNELQRILQTISSKTLSSTLKELEKDGLILRHEYPQIPPKVEYSLSPTGRTLIPVLDALCAWGEEHRSLKP